MTKVTVNLDSAHKDVKKFKIAAKYNVASVLKKEIKESILRGVSPVKGQGRFQKYSDLYLKMIRRDKSSGKKPSPVNLKLTGDLLKSLYVEPIKKGLVIGFDNKLADIHNRLGAGKSKVIRRMLPTNSGEQFNRRITKRLFEIMDRLAKQIFK